MGDATQNPGGGFVGSLYFGHALKYTDEPSLGGKTRYMEGAAADGLKVGCFESNTLRPERDNPAYGWGVTQGAG